MKQTLSIAEFRALKPAKKVKKIYAKTNNNKDQLKDQINCITVTKGRLTNYYYLPNPMTMNDVEKEYRL